MKAEQTRQGFQQKGCKTLQSNILFLHLINTSISLQAITCSYGLNIIFPKSKIKQSVGIKRRLIKCTYW